MSTKLAPNHGRTTDYVIICDHGPVGNLFEVILQFLIIKEFFVDGKKIKNLSETK